MKLSLAFGRRCLRSQGGAGTRNAPVIEAYLDRIQAEGRTSLAKRIELRQFRSSI